MEEYLHTVYEPDAEFVDGEIDERNIGEWYHSAVQFEMTRRFREHGKEWKVRALQEQRTLFECAKSPHFRRQRISARASDRAGVYLSVADCDRGALAGGQSRLQQRIQDFIDFGVENVWVIDPKKRIGWDYSDGNWIRKCGSK